MGFIWKLAFKNILRNKRRTAITLIAIVIGLTWLHVGLGMMDGLQHQSERNLIDYTLGHLKLYPPEYEPGEMPDLAHTINNYRQIADSLNHMPWVHAALGQVIFEAGVSNGYDYLPVMGVGLDPEAAEQATLLKNAIVAGKFLDADSDGLLLGINLAEILDFKVGSNVILDTRTVGGMRDALDITVVGLLRTGNPIVDCSSAYLSLDQAQILLDIPDQVTEILIRLDRERSPEAATAKIAGWLSSTDRILKVIPWKELAKDFIELHKMKKGGTGIMIGLMIVLVAVGIANTILMATFERSAEIGMMRAMGMFRGKVRLLFLYEGMLLGLIGGILAVIIGGAINIYLEQHGLNLTAMYGNADLGYPIKDYLYSDFNIAACITVLVFGAFMSTAASLYPAWRAGRQPVVDTFRHTT